MKLLLSHSSIDSNVNKQVLHLIYCNDEVENLVKILIAIKTPINKQLFRAFLLCLYTSK